MVAEARVEKPSDPSSSFYNWALTRHRRRTTRVMSLLIVLLALLVAATAFLVYRVADLQDKLAQVGAPAADLRQVTRGLEEAAVTQRNLQRRLAAANQRSRRMERCLDTTLHRLDSGIRRLLAGRLSARAFLSRYKIPRCR